MNESETAKRMFPHYRKLYEEPPDDDQPLYLAYWGDGYLVRDEHDVAIRTIDFFCDGNGFGPAEIQTIRNLRKGHVWEANMPEFLVVVRIR